MRVDVYRNLNQGGYSIKAMEGPQRGRVIAHRDEVEILNATFVVQAAGHEAAGTSGQRNVHAFVRGEWHDRDPEAASDAITYDPFGPPAFTRVHDDAPLQAADRVALTNAGAFASGLLLQ